MKKCTMCSILKKKKEFSGNKKSIDKLKDECKECVNSKLLGSKQGRSKICSVCKQNLSLINFYNDAKSKDQHKSTCKKCTRFIVHDKENNIIIPKFKIKNDIFFQNTMAVNGIFRGFDCDLNSFNIYSVSTFLSQTKKYIKQLFGDMLKHISFNAWFVLGTSLKNTSNEAFVAYNESEKYAIFNTDDLDTTIDEIIVYFSNLIEDGYYESSGIVFNEITMFNIKTSIGNLM